MSPFLFFRVVTLEARKLMSYRVDFWLSTFATFAVQLAIAYFLWRAVFEATGKSQIGGFSFDGMVLYYVLAILVAKLIPLQGRHLSIAEDIYEGSLTRYLIYPASYSAFKLGEHVGLVVPAILQVALIAPLTALAVPMPEEFRITPLSVTWAALAVILANLMAFLIRLPVQAVAFWADNVWSLNVMVRFASEMLGGLMLPLSLFPSALAALLDWLPFKYFYAFPVLTLVGQTTFEEWLRGMGGMVIWCVLLAALSRWVLRRGYRVYTGVGI